MAISRIPQFKDRLLGSNKREFKQIEEIRQRIQEYKEMVSSLDENVSYDSDLKNDIEIIEGDLLADFLELANGTEYPKELCEQDNQGVYSKGKALKKHYYIDSRYEERIEKSMFPVTGEETTTLRAASYFNQIAHKIQKELIKESEFLGYYSLNAKDNERFVSGAYKKALTIIAEQNINFDYNSTKNAIESDKLDLEDKNIVNITSLMRKVGIDNRFITRQSMDSFNKCLRLQDIALDIFNAKTAAYNNLIHSYLAKEKEGLEHKVDLGYQVDKQNKIKGKTTAVIIGKGEKDLLPTAGHISFASVDNMTKKFNVKLPKYNEVPTKGTCAVPLELADMDNPSISNIYKEYLKDAQLYDNYDNMVDICANRFNTLKTAIEKLVKLNILNKGEESKERNMY